jgi:hypothetical protein
MGTWVAVTVVAWHLAFFATGAVTLALATSPAGTVFEGLAEPFHQRLVLASHLRVLSGYAVVALGALALAYPAVRLWTGTGRVSRWGIVARTLVVLAVIMAHGWLRLVHSQPYFLGPSTYDTWYFRLLGGWSEEVRERVLFLLFVFLPAVAAVGAAGVYVVEAARWFREGGRTARWLVAAAGSSAVLLAGWWTAPHFIRNQRTPNDARWNVVMLSSDEVRSTPGVPESTPHQPTLAALAARSVVLANMRSPLPSALGEAASLMTGQAPHSHGLQTPHPSREQVARALAQSPRLAAQLASQGYATAIVGDEAAGAFALADGLGFSEIEAGSPTAYPRHLAGMIYPAHFIIPAWLDNRLGRRLLPDLGVLPGCVSPETITDRLTDRLEKDAEAGEPFFLHGVYSQSSPVTPPLSGTATPPRPSTFDAQLSRVLECLEENGLRDNTILVVLGRSHSMESWPSAPLTQDVPTPTDTPIPVILHVPEDSVVTGVLPHLTRLIDLAPTLLDLLGLPVDPFMEGVSLRPCLENHAVALPLAAFGESAGFPDHLPGPDDNAPVRTVFREALQIDPDSGYRLVLKDPSAAQRRKIRWVRTHHWQLVFTPAEASRDGIDEWHLFDLRSDPNATRDVKLQNPKVWQTLELALRRWADEKTESRLSDIFPNGEPPAAVLPGT